MSLKTGPEPSPVPVRPRSRRRWSLALRLAAWFGAAAFGLVLAATGGLYWGLAAHLDREDDEELADTVAVLRAALHDRPGDLAAIREQAEEGWAARERGRVHVRVLAGDGRAAYETPGMDRLLPAGGFPPASADAAAPPGLGQDVHAPDGTPFRLVSARAAAGQAGAPAFTIQAALDRSPEQELLAEYRGTLWVVLALALAACTLGGFWIARRGLRPLQQVAATAARIRPSTLGERLNAAGLPAELAALAETFNAMLDRLEDSFGRLAEFSANIAHELRTPVNNLRGVAEVALGKPRSADEYRDALGSCLEECARLSRLIDGLLFLARAENPKTQVEREPVEVGRELEAVRDFFEAAAAEAGVRLTAAAPPGLVAEANRPLLQRAVGNLVTNALAHTPPGGTVALTGAEEDGRVRIEVADDGRGIETAHLPRLFERFYRADPARSSASGGLGLGLALVKGIAELHGGSVRLASEVGRGTRVTLLLPAAGKGGGEATITET